MTASSTQTTAAARLVQALEHLEVEVVFGLPGVHNLALWKALAGSTIRLVGVRHEQTAVYAADGYARASGTLGVALVTTGPGAANTICATGEAMASSSPVLVIATEIPSALRRDGVYRGVLHENRDQTRMFEPVTKATRVVAAAAEIASAVVDAAAVARAPNSGPVYLGIPTDLLVQEVPEPSPLTQGRTAAIATDLSGLERAAELLRTARRPLVWAGGGALRAGAGTLVGEVAGVLDAPVLTTYGSRGLLAPDHPQLVAGPVHAPDVGALWDQADVVLAVGTDLDGMMTQNWLMPQPPTLVSINVDREDANKNYSCEVTLVGDARHVLERLLPLVADRAGSAEGAAGLDSVANRVAASIAEDEPQAAALLESLDRALPADTIVVADMCIPGYWIAGYRRVPLPRKLAYPMGWGTLGFGFPASLGGALAGAGPAVCVTGDGGFLFACGELATVAQEQIPVTIILVDDGGYGMLRFDQVHAGDDPFGVDLVRPDFAALAASFGIGASVVEGFGEEFVAELERAVASGRAHLLVVNAALKPPPTTSPRWYRRQRSPGT